MQPVEMFPETPVDSIPDGPLSISFNKKDFLNLPEVIAFVYKLQYCDDDPLVKFYQLKRGPPLAWTKDEEKLQENFLRSAMEAGKFQRFEPKLVDFEKLESRFSKPVRRFNNNTDVRTGYVWDHHTFLVKAFFTFGQRTVPSQKIHVFRTTQAPVLFYKLDKSKPCLLTKFKVRDGRFHKIDQFVYDRYVLQPNSTYCVPENTTYAILTVQKTLFSVHVSSDRDIRQTWKRPDADKNLDETIKRQNELVEGKSIYVNDKKRKTDCRDEPPKKRRKLDPNQEPLKDQVIFPALHLQDLVKDDIFPSLLEGEEKSSSPLNIEEWLESFRREGETFPESDDNSWFPEDFLQVQLSEISPEPFEQDELAFLDDLDLFQNDPQLTLVDAMLTIDQLTRENDVLRKKLAKLL